MRRSDGKILAGRKAVVDCMRRWYQEGEEGGWKINKMGAGAAAGEQRGLRSGDVNDNATNDADKKTSKERARVGSGYTVEDLKGRDGRSHYVLQ